MNEKQITIDDILEYIEQQKITCQILHDNANQVVKAQDRDRYRHKQIERLAAYRDIAIFIETHTKRD